VSIAARRRGPGESNIMKAFDLEKLDTTYRFTVWDREVPEWRYLAKAKELKLTLVKQPGMISVLKRVQVAGKKRQTAEEIGYLLSELPDVEFEGGARLKKRPKKPKA
jgi:hypothetical protein